MGALFQGRCYDTQQKATDAFFTSVGPQYQQSGTNAGQQTFFYAKYTSGWYVCVESVNSGTAPVCTVATSPVFPDCTDESAGGFADGVTIGWGVAAAMVAAYAIAVIRKGL